MFPADQRELVIATAWRLVEEGQTVLVFCPQRNSVGPYAREIMRLHKQGLVSPVLPPEVDLTDALAVGASGSASTIPSWSVSSSAWPSTTERCPVHSGGRLIHFCNWAA